MSDVKMVATTEQFISQVKHKTVAFFHHVLVHFIALAFNRAPSPRLQYLVALRMLYVNALAQDLDIDEILRDFQAFTQAFKAEELAAMHQHYQTAATAEGGLREKGYHMVVMMAPKASPLPEAMGLDPNDTEWMTWKDTGLEPLTEATSEPHRDVQPGDPPTSHLAHWNIPRDANGHPYKN